MVKFHSKWLECEVSNGDQIEDWEDRFLANGAKASQTHIAVSH
jgi:hypothetical protein